MLDLSRPHLSSRYFGYHKPARSPVLTDQRSTSSRADLLPRSWSMPQRRRHDGREPQDDMPRSTDSAGSPDRAPPLGQLPLDFSPARRHRESALSRAAPSAQPMAAPARYFTRRE